jgi:hypothetical protein
MAIRLTDAQRSWAQALDIAAAAGGSCSLVGAKREGMSTLVAYWVAKRMTTQHMATLLISRDRYTMARDIDTINSFGRAKQINTSDRMTVLWRPGMFKSRCIIAACDLTWGVPRGSNVITCWTEHTLPLPEPPGDTVEANARYSASRISHVRASFVTE